MSIKSHLVAVTAFVLLVVSAATANAAVNCTMNYPDGKPVGTDDGAVFYPNGAALHNVDGSMLYPAGQTLRDAQGVLMYPSGNVLRQLDGSMFYADGGGLRSADGYLWDEKGADVTGVARSTVAVDTDTTLVIRGRQRDSSYKLRIKTQATELVVNLDDQGNLSCEFVKPIGH